MKGHTPRRSKGFTLIELLIVIGIVVILAVAAVLTLNPAELLRQARDSNRVNDLGTIKSALALYLADATAPSLGSTSVCYVHQSSTVASGTSCATMGTVAGRFTVAGGGATVTSTTGITGLGWIPVNFSSISAGSPISAEPTDPVNNITYFYAYRPGAGFTYELNADMESTKYSQSGGSDAETTDGGNTNQFFEVGTAPGLAL